MIRRASVILTAILLLAACVGRLSDPVAEAEYEYSVGDVDAARSICENLLAGTRADSLSVDNLCRLSVLMVKLAEHGDEEASMVAAARCMQTAISRDSDSVAAFVRALPVDEQAQTVLIQQLSNSIDQPFTLTDTIPEPNY